MGEFFRFVAVVSTRRAYKMRHIIRVRRVLEQRAVNMCA